MVFGLGLMVCDFQAVFGFSGGLWILSGSWIWAWHLDNMLIISAVQGILQPPFQFWTAGLTHSTGELSVKVCTEIPAGHGGLTPPSGRITISL